MRYFIFAALFALCLALVSCAAPTNKQVFRFVKFPDPAIDALSQALARETDEDIKRAMDNAIENIAHNNCQLCAATSYFDRPGFCRGCP